MVGARSKQASIPYHEAIGTLNYIMSGTRTDTASATNTLARFAQAPTVAYWLAVRREMRYLAHTSKYGIIFDGREKQGLIAFSDADLAGCREIERSVSGTIVNCASAPVILKSTKQTTVAESTCEAEFVASTVASREIVWAKQFLTELKVEQREPTTLFADNQSAIKLVSNSTQHTKIRHVDIKLFAQRERV